MAENNLDVLINKISYDIAKEANAKGVQNELEKLLGILINDGVYAYFVYCRSRKSKNKKNENNKDNKQKQKNTKNEKNEINYVEKIFIEKIIKSEDGKDLINAMGLSKDGLNKNIEKFFEELPKNLDELLFFRSVLERILTYARYHLKSMEDNNGGKSA
ncbi:hypothetical protein [Defluviitalea phaphyphila]|uniref:hypothetical protein n=1 Tax=Defluviitalea phaphyphila TaxID=1473580 RepID=UPI0007301C9E|nr:hypothetical protein [Defluviitalea phaphyphila]